MKVLFVSSGNTAFGVSPITKNQGDSLALSGVEMSYFPITGRGLLNYTKNIIRLKCHLSRYKYDIVHAHYSLTAFVSTVAYAKPLIVSLMGSDIKLNCLTKLFVKIFSRFFWARTIVKSYKMGNSLGLSNIFVIPNGVDVKVFKSIERSFCQKESGWDLNKKHILFAAKPSRPEKNFVLAEQAFSLISDDNINLHSLIDVMPEQVPLLMNSADVVLLVSLWEGSPNVIKEAMACNRPIVSTDVGDVRWVFGDTPGCYVASFDPDDVATKLKKALEFSEQHHQTSGRERIMALGLDSESTARRIIAVYKSVLDGNVQ